MEEDPLASFTCRNRWYLKYQPLSKAGWTAVRISEMYFKNYSPKRKTRERCVTFPPFPRPRSPKETSVEPALHSYLNVSVINCPSSYLQYHLWQEMQARKVLRGASHLSEQTRKISRPANVTRELWRTENSLVYTFLIRKKGTKLAARYHPLVKSN